MQKKVLIISTVGLIYDGITSVILSYLQAMDRSGLDIYVASTIKCEDDIKRKLESINCHVVDFPSRRNETSQYFFSLVSFIRKNNIEVVHAHGNSGTLAIEMVAGWLGGCKKRIAHSHNTRCDQVKADKLLRPVFDLFYTDAMACGDAAGRWLFKDKPFTILSNGRDVTTFAFNESIRVKKRAELNLKNEIAIGHVGGFFEQKNHKFLLKIFREILRKEPTAHFYLIGDGPLRAEIELSAKDLKDNLVLVGTTPYVSDYLQAMDGMLLPSLFEGLPLVAIEWQINGLPCVLSDAVTKECSFTENCTFMSLDESAEVWANKIIEMSKKDGRAVDSKRGVIQAKADGYDINENAKLLRKIYVTKPHATLKLKN